MNESQLDFSLNFDETFKVNLECVENFYHLHGLKQQLNLESDDSICIMFVIVKVRPKNIFSQLKFILFLIRVIREQYIYNL
jgi:hypothetical protein